MRAASGLLAWALLGSIVGGALARRLLATIDLFVDGGEERLTLLAVRRRDRELARQAKSLVVGRAR